ncbi:Protein OS-9-like protein [Dichanthelium oligosanthes]|uniref:Protein OS-9 homolog n=1 Tax=Dichanthelium oligosanthes TaxID=888268 RepID=A0A1E5VRX0_9POAL|nr:Protein OS-9-like protein [Dichanthelium oligosanthes]
MGFAGRVSALLFLLVAGAVATDQIFTASGVPFGRSSREPRYRVEFHPADSHYQPENGQESVPMTSHEGKRYMCFLPVEETKTMKSILPQNATNVIIESDRRIKPKEPDELLELLKDQCFYRGIKSDYCAILMQHEGWWSYEFCYHGKIRQVHVEGEKVIQEYVLGEYDNDATTAYHENSTSEFAGDDHHVKDITKRYHVHLYTNGTVCDLTDIPRETEVRFVCSEPIVLISSIKEISSCKYVVTIQNPMLCKNPLFQQEKRTLSIHCNQLAAEAEPTVTVEDDSLPKEAQISIIPDQDELHDLHHAT